MDRWIWNRQMLNSTALGLCIQMAKVSTGSNEGALLHAKSSCCAISLWTSLINPHNFVTENEVNIGLHCMYGGSYFIVVLSDQVAMCLVVIRVFQSSNVVRNSHGVHEK